MASYVICSAALLGQSGESTQVQLINTPHSNSSFACLSAFGGIFIEGDVVLSESETENEFGKLAMSITKMRLILKLLTIVALLFKSQVNAVNSCVPIINEVNSDCPGPAATEKNEFIELRFVPAWLLKQYLLSISSMYAVQAAFN